MPVEDDLRAQLLPHFESCFDFIENAREADGSVLVHCEVLNPPNSSATTGWWGQAGVSRSATVVVGFLMCRLGKSLEVVELLRYDMRHYN